MVYATKKCYDKLKTLSFLIISGLQRQGLGRYSGHVQGTASNQMCFSPQGEGRQGEVHQVRQGAVPGLQEGSRRKMYSSSEGKMRGSSL